MVLWVSWIVLVEEDCERACANGVCKEAQCQDVEPEQQVVAEVRAVNNEQA